jgi:hypothetical protein
MQRFRLRLPSWLLLLLLLSLTPMLRLSSLLAAAHLIGNVHQTVHRLCKHCTAQQQKRQQITRGSKPTTAASVWL